MKYIFIAGLAVAVVAVVVMSAVYLGGNSSTKVCILAVWCYGNNT